MALIDILVRAQDQASATLNRVSGSGQRLETRFDAASRKMTEAGQRVQGLQSKVQGLTLPLIAAGALFTKFAADSIQAASAQNEAVNKSSEIFGAAADDVEAFANTSARAFGISKTAALAAASGFGNILQVSGLTEEASADMSVSLVKLAADLASFNDIDPTEALEKLRSGLVGEAEPLRTVGVLLSDARVKQEAYSAGIAHVGAELTEAQKVQARYNIILADTAKAQGDFARTSDGAANGGRRLSAMGADLQARIGRGLLPVVEQLQRVLSALLPVFGLVADAAGHLLLVLGGYLALRGLPRILDAIAFSVVNLGKVGAVAGGAASQLALSLGGLSRMAGPVGIAIGAMILAHDQLRASNEAARKAVQASWDELLATLEKGGDVADTARSHFEELFSEAPGWALETVGLGSSWEEVTRRLDDAEEAARRHAQAQDLLQLRTEALDPALADTARRARIFAGVLDESGEVAQGVRDQYDALGGGLSSVKRGFELSANAAARAAQVMADKQERIAEDLRRLDEIPIGEGLKARLLELGPEMVDRFVRGNRNQRAKIRDGLRRYDEALEETNTALDRIATEGGNDVGRSLVTGAISGIVDGSPKLSAAARQAVLDAIAAGREAAEATSPSRKMARLGLDMIDGLIQGMERRLGRLLDLVQEIMGQEIPKAFRASGRDLATSIREHERLFDRLLERARDRLQRIQDAVSSFRDQVRSGFSDAGDIVSGFIDGLRSAAESGGTFDVNAFLGQTLASNEAFAAALEQLSAMGLDPRLLAEFAGRGPEALPELQQLIAGGPELIERFNDIFDRIQDVAEAAEDKLTEAGFGDKLKAAARLVDRLNDRIARFIEKTGQHIERFLKALQADALARGVKDLVKAIEDAIRRLGGQITAGGGGSSSTPAPATTTTSTSGGGGTTSGSGSELTTGGRPNSPPIIRRDPVVININGTPNVDERTIMNAFRRAELLVGARGGSG